MNIQEYIITQQNDIEQCLNSLLGFPAQNDTADTLKEAMRYAVFSGGKRIRPVLSMAVCDTFNGHRDNALVLACAIELIHSYSLIHDDLPCMDNDDLRRGKPTCHKVFGEAIALLAGNALLSLSFSLITEKTSLGPDKKIAAVEELANASGFNGLIGGQAADLLMEGHNPATEMVMYIHRHKTARLFQAAVTVGGLSANIKDDVLKMLADFGLWLGHAFQIQDDILDVAGDEQKAGKKLRKDTTKNKPSIIKVLGLSKAQKRLQEHLDNALEIIKPYDNAGYLSALVRKIAHREK